MQASGSPQRRIVEFGYREGNNSPVVEQDTRGGVTAITGTPETCFGNCIRAVNKVAHLLHGQQLGFDAAGARKETRYGKWVLTFPKGDSRVQEAWEKVVEAVKGGKFYEAKVYVPTEGYEQQTILIYTADSTCRKDRNRCAKLIDELDLIEPGEKISYKLEIKTAKGEEEILCTHKRPKNFFDKLGAGVLNFFGGIRDYFVRLFR